MRLLACCLFVLLMLFLIAGCAAPHPVYVPMVPEKEEEPGSDPEEVLAEMGRNIGAAMLETQWLQECSGMPVVLLGDLSGIKEQGLSGKPYLDALGKRLLDSKKLIIVQPRAADISPVLPLNATQADSLARDSGAGCFGHSLIDGPRGQRRLLLRIYSLPQLKLLASASIEFDL